MSSVEQINEQLKHAPDWMVREVADFIGYLQSKGAPPDSKKRLEDFRGVLKGSSSFEGDPVAIQRAMRDEWN